jgi:choline dehydrogenase-like flavoprotein
LKIGISDFQYPDVVDYYKAFAGAGLHAARSGDNGEAYGTAWYPNTMNPKTGERSHARNSYYDPVSKRSNLEVMLETLATEIVFDGNRQLTAKGVKVTDKRTGTTKTVYAKKELILACGSINTPQLLQLSGIGPRSVLEAAGIPVKLAHDGVGANFQDHPYTNVQYNMSNLSKPNPSSFNDPAFNASAWEQYRANKTGPLTLARGNGLAMVPLQIVDPENYSNLAEQVRGSSNDAYLPALYKNSKKLLKGFKAQRAILADLYESAKAGVVEHTISGSGTFNIVGLEKPISRGTVTINPANPRGPPNIFYNALSNPVDRAVLATCVRFLRTVLARPELAKFSPMETSPGAQYTTDDEIIKRSIEVGSVIPTLSHPSCTCAMMPEDMGGCVSDKLLFYGVKHMSIVDASIIPIVPTQHIQSTMYAIGEKAASIIKSRG